MGKKDQIILVCGGSFAAEIYDLFSDDQSFEIVGFLDDDKDCYLSEKSKNLMHMGSIFSQNIDDKYFLHIATGNWELNHKIFSYYKKLNKKLYTLIHPKALVSKSAKISDGCYIGPNSIVSSNTILETNVSVNFSCGVGHDCNIGRNTIVSPHVMINGNCKVGESSFFGTGAVIFQNLNIGNFSTIDSGTVLRTNMNDFDIASGREKSNIVKNKLKEHFFKAEE